MFKLIVSFALLWSSNLLAKDAGVLLVTPFMDKESILLDAATGQEIHVWKNDYYNAGSSRLLADGALLRVVEMSKEKTFSGSGFQGGGLEIIEKDGTPRWRFWCATTFEMNVVDALMLPNGNILAIMLEWKSREEAIKAGRDPSLLDEKGFLVPALTEYKIMGPTLAAPVWSWSLWNHLYQSRDKTLECYSATEEKGCIDINVRSSPQGKKWLVPTGLSYSIDEDIIAMTVYGFSEPFLIDHSTSPLEASSDEGGRRRLGGRILNSGSAALEKQNEKGVSMILSGAQWALTNHGDSSSLYAMFYYKGGYCVVSQLYSELKGLHKEMVLFEWESSKFNAIFPSTSLDPTFLFPTEDKGWIAYNRENGKVAMVDLLTHKQLWAYQNIYGGRQMMRKKEGGCCGDVTGDQGDKMHPIRSIYYYPAGYLQSYPSK